MSNLTCQKIYRDISIYSWPLRGILSFKIYNWPIILLRKNNLKSIFLLKESVLESLIQNTVCLRITYNIRDK